MDFNEARQKINRAIEDGEKLILKTCTYYPYERDFIDHVLCQYLNYIGVPGLQNTLAYCLHELAGNAKRANTKRVYFIHKGYSIDDPEEYAKGMKDFKEDTFSNLEHYLKMQKDLDYFIKFHFHYSNGFLYIAVKNNVELAVEEKTRISEKVSLASTINSIPEAYTLLDDSTEGAGLGIVMMMQMLKNVGLSEDVFTIRSFQSHTAAVLKLDPTQVKEPETDEQDAVLMI